MAVALLIGRQLPNMRHHDPEFEDDFIGPTPPQCEQCDNLIRDCSPEQMATDTEGRRYCGIDCMQEAEDERRMWQDEDSRQYEMFGADHDSWYR